MKEFRVTLTQRAGELARLAQLLADASIDLRSVAAISEGNKAHVCLVVTDVAATRATGTGGTVAILPQDSGLLFVARNAPRPERERMTTGGRT